MEALRPIVANKCNAEKETKGWDRPPLTAHHFILAASATNGTSISDLATSHNPPLPQHKERDGPTNRLFPDLRKEKYLPTYLLLSGPPRRVHPGHTGSRRAKTTIASSDPSIFGRTRERPAVGISDPSPPNNGTRPLIKGGRGRAPLPEGPCPCIHTISATLNAEIYEGSRGLPRSREPDLFSDGDVVMSH